MHASSRGTFSTSPWQGMMFSASSVELAAYNNQQLSGGRGGSLTGLPEGGEGILEGALAAAAHPGSMEQLHQLPDTMQSVLMDAARMYLGVHMGM
jgi:hypothetical protein